MAAPGHGAEKRLAHWESCRTSGLETTAVGSCRYAYAPRCPYVAVEVVGVACIPRAQVELRYRLLNQVVGAVLVAALEISQAFERRQPRADVCDVIVVCPAIRHVHLLVACLRQMSGGVRLYDSALDRRGLV